MAEGLFWVDKGFWELFWDSVWFARHISKKRKSLSAETESRFARAVIINAALCLECAANCCLDELAGKFSDDADKLPPLSKLDVYLLFRGKKPLNRGDKYVQPMAELIDLRNQHAHPKVHKRKASFHNSTLPYYMIENTTKVKQCLGVCNDASMWDSQAATRVLQALGDFLTLYFLEACGHNPQEVVQLLTSGPQLPVTLLPRGMWTPEELRAFADLKINLRFIGI